MGIILTEGRGDRGLYTESAGKQGRKTGLLYIKK